MSGSKRLFIIVLLFLILLGVLGVIAGFVLGAHPVQIVRDLVQQAAERLHAHAPALAGKFAGMTGALL
jgi:hypothetical protein